MSEPISSLPANAGCSPSQPHPSRDDTLGRRRKSNSEIKRGAHRPSSGTTGGAKPCHLQQPHQIEPSLRLTRIARNADQKTHIIHTLVSCSHTCPTYTSNDSDTNTEAPCGHGLYRMTIQPSRYDYSCLVAYRGWSVLYACIRLCIIERPRLPERNDSGRLLTPLRKPAT